MSGYNPYAAGATGYNNGAGMMMLSAEDALDNTAGQSLDDIVNQNLQTMRRQSMPQRYAAQQAGMDAEMRRISMMDFTGASPSSPLEHFQFDPSTALDQADTMNTGQAMMSTQNMRSQRRTSGGDVSMNAGFANSNPAYGAIMPQTSTYHSPVAQGNPSLEMDMNSPYVSNPMSMSMDYSNGSNLAGVGAVDHTHMSMYGQTPYHQSMMNSPMHPSVSGSMRGMQLDPAGNRLERQRSHFEHSQSRSSTDVNLAARPQLSRSQSTQMSNMTPQHQQTPNMTPQHQPNPSMTPQRQQTPNRTPQQQQAAHSHIQSNTTASQRHQSNAGFAVQSPNAPPNAQQENGLGRGPPTNSEVDPPGQNSSNQAGPLERLEGNWPSTMVGRPHMQSEFKNAYSSTGFDMLGVLMRVATRPKPEINIGAVDLSCAFVVCDAEKDDNPIVYCSDNFERLTGYTRHMILGRNCRFLQSPDGQVEPGIKRKYVDDDSILYLKNMVNTRREAQISLINYRRGGQPFMNLLTMIPISWDSDQVKFFVGFQVDLVEQPNAVTDRNPDGTYAINYQRGITMPRYVMNAPEGQRNRTELGQTVPRDDVSAILTTIGTGESEYAKRMWDKVLLENTDDVVHVLSLKGLFQWISPSSVKVLEYEPAELIGTALSSVCHPSDIVPVTRELKDTSTGASVNVVFRIRRKHSGYMWFEGHGSLHTEQGKGRKSIILVGRERPVYTLSKNDIAANNGIGENELWTKMSTSGMFLFVASNVRQLLDRQPDELVGISIQSLMRSESKTEFARILEHARTGKKASVKHEMINRRGQVLQAFTTLYPGDATEGQKPTFIVAQTRLVKYPRGNAANRAVSFSRGNDQAVSESAQSGIPGTPGQHLVGHMTSVTGAQTPTSTHQAESMKNYVQTEGTAPTHGGQNGLIIGRQDVSLASEDNLFDELKTTKSSSWQYEIRQLEKRNRLLAEEVQSLLAAKKKRKRRKGAGQMQKDCANCHTRVTPEWRRGPSGQRDLCNSCGLRWAKQNGRVSPRTSSLHSVHSGGAASDKASLSPRHFNGLNSHASVKAEPPTPAQQPSTLRTMSSTGQTGQTISAGSQQLGHAAHMQGASGVPDKIEEDVES